MSHGLGLEEGVYFTYGHYIKLLVIIDTIYIAGGLWLFGSLMED